jgi:hypothetical protein
VIMAERALWKETLKDQGKGGDVPGRPNVSPVTGENRNVRLCSLRGALFNKVPELDDDEIREALLAANQEFIEPLSMAEMEATVLKPKPGWVRHPACRHASIPRLRVPPPAELDEYADRIVQEVTGPVREAAEAARPQDPDAEDAQWGT